MSAKKSGGSPSGGDRDPGQPSMNRIALWVIVSAIGLYFLISGATEILG